MYRRNRNLYPSTCIRMSQIALKKFVLFLKNVIFTDFYTIELLIIVFVREYKILPVSSVPKADWT